MPHSTEKPETASVESVVVRLRERANWLESRSFAVLDGSMEREAADMLEFFFGQMQMHSPKMNGQHSYRFLSGGWPMNHCVGPSAEEAVRSAMKEIERSRSESE